MVVPEDHKIGALIKLPEYETINIESFKKNLTASSLWIVTW